ncbi:hypothetical protein KSF73_07860 [Burkholderiaceae bacterium DAT-1]|nr:hypothetical protein [Burkholderiaceae bacterium DAT-1]
MIRISSRQRWLLGVLICISLSACVLITQRMQRERRIDANARLQKASTGLNAYLSRRLGLLLNSHFFLLNFVQPDAGDGLRIDPQADALRMGCHGAMTLNDGSLVRLEIVFNAHWYRCQANGEPMLSGQTSRSDLAILKQVQMLAPDSGVHAGPASASQNTASPPIMELLTPVSINNRIVGFTRSHIHLGTLISSYPDGPPAGGRLGLRLDGEHSGTTGWLWQKGQFAPQIEANNVLSTHLTLTYPMLDGRPYPLVIESSAPFVSGPGSRGVWIVGGLLLLASIVNGLVYQLMRAHARLGQSLQIRTRRLQRSKRTLAEKQAESVQLMQALTRAGESERQRLGGELHDNTGQLLVAARLLSDHIGHSCAPALRPFCDELSDVLGEAVRSVRISAHRLDQPDATRGGLMTALQHMARQFSHGGCSVEVQGDATGAHNESDALHLLRIAQEAVNNAIRHGGSTRVEVVLGGECLLVIRDNGGGFNPQQSISGMGMRTLARRAGLLQARLDIHSQPGHTEIRIIPATVPASAAAII